LQQQLERQQRMRPLLEQQRLEQQLELVQRQAQQELLFYRKRRVQRQRSKRPKRVTCSCQSP
jgi:hypothetical protein